LNHQNKSVINTTSVKVM